MHIRFATIEDTEALLNIYQQYINTNVTFEYVLPTAQDFSKRIRDIISFYPYLVAVENDRIIGYAYASKAFERAAYDWCADLSIYLDQNYRQHGLGRTLYTLTMEILKLQGFKTTFGIVTGTNNASIAFHTALGFDKVGTFPCNGYKNHTWLDVIWFEKALAPYNDNPEAVKALSSLNKQQIQVLLTQAAKE